MTTEIRQKIAYAAIDALTIVTELGCIVLFCAVVVVGSILIGAK